MFFDKQIRKDLIVKPIQNACIMLKIFQKYSLSIILLSSCNYSNNSIENTHYISHNMIHIKNNYIGKGGSIILIDNKLIGIDFYGYLLFTY